jgi:hypothetical protein
MARKEKKFHYIYKIINTKNDKYYIGMHSTDSLEDNYMGSGKRIRNSIRKHGLEVHTKEILEFSVNRESLKKREQEIVNESLITDPKCLNLQTGGGGGFSSEEHRMKFISNQSLKAHKTNEKIKNDPSSWKEACKNNPEKISKKLKKMYASGEINPSFIGKKHKEETILLMKEKKKGQGIGESNSQFGRKWMFNENLKKSNPVNSEDIEKLISEGWKIGRKMSFK